MVPYASRIENGRLCPDCQGRCEVALKTATETNGIIVIGVGKKPGENSTRFSEAMYAFFVEHGFPKDRIIVSPSGGWSTVYESQAAYDAVKQAGDGRIIAVSAWYHVLRVWLIWALTFGRLVGIQISWKTYPWTNPIREVAALPFTLAKILRARIKLGT